MARNRFNIYLRKDGRYEGRYADGAKKNGKSKYRSVYGYSYEEVKKKLEAIQSERFVTSSRTDLTVHSLFAEWFQAIASRVKESTIANYRMKADRHILPVFGNLAHSAVNTAMVQDFINQKMKHGLSARYVSDIVVLLKSVFKYASRTYQIDNPIANVILPKKKKPEIRLLNTIEQNKLQAYLLTNQNPTSLGIALSMYTGIRIGELCALRWNDIDLEKRTLTVRHTIQRIRKANGVSKTQLIITEPKSNSSVRTIPIPECLMDMLRRFSSLSTDYVLSGNHKPVEPRTMQYRFASILKRVNLPSVHFHSLRHLFATNCVALGFDVKALSELLGHSSVEITLNRYVHSSLEQKRTYMERFSFAA